MTKKKIFFPWTQHLKEEWLSENKNKIIILGAAQKDFYSKKEKSITGKLTTIFYKEKE